MRISDALDTITPRPFERLVPGYQKSLPIGFHLRPRDHIIPWKGGDDKLYFGTTPVGKQLDVDVRQKDISFLSQRRLFEALEAITTMSLYF